MKCIVPLAGADFHSASYGIKPLFPVDGEPLIEKVLLNRPWFRNGELGREDFVFVLRKGEGLEEFRDYLARVFPVSRLVTLSHPTGGALLSAMAGASLLTDFDEPLVVDLADILFSSDICATRMFEDEPELAGLLPYFESSEACFSYLLLEGSRVRRTAEKQVISTHASAGTYFFRTLSEFVTAAAGSLAAGDAYTYRGIHFVCPSFNALVASGKLVRGVAVTDVVAVSSVFHLPSTTP